MSLNNFFSFKLNRRILLSFLLIIVIPGFVSFWVTSFVIQKTLNKEIEHPLVEASSVYFEELDSIEQKCIDIVSVYSGKSSIVEIEDHKGKVLF